MALHVDMCVIWRVSWFVTLTQTLSCSECEINQRTIALLSVGVIFCSDVSDIRMAIFPSTLSQV